MRAIVGLAATAVLLASVSLVNAVSISEYFNGYGASVTPVVTGFNDTATGLNGGTGWPGRWYTGTNVDFSDANYLANYVPGSQLLTPYFKSGATYVTTIGYQSTGNNTGASDGLAHTGTKGDNLGPPMFRSTGGLTGTIWASVLVNDSIAMESGAFKLSFNGSTTAYFGAGPITYATSWSGGGNLNGTAYPNNYLDAWNNPAVVDLYLIKIAGVGGGGTVNVTIWQDPLDVTGGEGGLTLPVGSGFAVMTASLADSALGGAINNIAVLLGGNETLSLLSVDAIRISNDPNLAFGFVTTGIAVVPEPATLSLLALGGLALLRRRT